MATIRQVRKTAGYMGVTVNYDRAIGHLEAIAPKGQVFRANGCHSLCHHFERGPWHAEMLDDLQDDLHCGLEPCEDLNCEICIEPAH